MQKPMSDEKILNQRVMATMVYRNREQTLHLSHLNTLQSAFDKSKNLLNEQINSELIVSFDCLIDAGYKLTVFKHPITIVNLAALEYYKQLQVIQEELDNLNAMGLYTRLIDIMGNYLDDTYELV